MTTPRAPHRGTALATSHLRCSLRWPVAALLLAGCSAGTGTDSTRHPRSRHANPRVEIERLMGHEHQGLDTHAVRLLDGAVEGRVEARGTPKVECATKDSGFSCTVGLELGVDDDGQPHRIGCFVTTDLEPFGPIIKAGQGPTWLMEPPTLEAGPRGEGIAVSFVANNAFEDETGSFVGTLKIAALYSQGYMASCFDLAAGGRETFARVTSGFFDSLRFGTRPRDPALFSMAYRLRKGERTVGFRYGFVTTDGKQSPRFTEHETGFSLDVDDKTWELRDHADTVVRKADGTVESYRSARWFDGKGPRVLTAKPSEGGRLRIKTELGSRSDAIELTPKAALDTELWIAAQLQRIATKQSEQHVYAWPIVDDGDPSLGYVVLTPGSAGVVVEQTRSHRRFDEVPDPTDDARDELHVDARGVVTKEVRATSVDELLFTRGALPESSPQAAVATAPVAAPPPAAATPPVAATAPAGSPRVLKPTAVPVAMPTPPVQVPSHGGGGAR